MKQSTSQLLLTEELAYFIKVSLSGKRLTPSGRKITAGTIINYRHVLRLLKEYEERNAVQLRIQLLHRASMRTLKREKNYWARFFIAFSDFLYKEKNCYDNYVLNVFKIIKTVFNYLNQEKGYVIGNYHKLFRIPVLQASPVVLTPGQLQFLITNKEFENSLNRFQRRARDIFVFGCTVGLRFSDLMSLKKVNIIEANNKTYLCLFTQKTCTEIRLPLPQYAIDIIYRYQRKAGKYLLPRLLDSNLNLQIKKLICLAKWNHTVPKYISCRGRMTELKTLKGNTWLFYQHITAHTMRRTAITILLTLGVQENIVRKFSGHAAGSKEFYKYVGLAQEYLNQEVTKAYEKLLEMPLGAVQ